MARCGGLPPAGRVGGEAVTGSASLPSDPVSRLSLFLFQTTWTRRGLQEGTQAAPAAVAATASTATPSPIRSRLVPAARSFAEGVHMASQAHSLSYSGCNFLRQRLVLSTLSGRPVKIRKIRARDDNPGLRGNSGARSSQGGRRARGATALLPWGPGGREPPGSVGA